MAESKGKDSLMKMLLSSGSVSGPSSYGGPPPRLNTPSSSIPSPLSETGDDSCPMLSSYLNQVSTTGQDEAMTPIDKVHLDHNYARSGHEALDHSHIRPTKTLFMSKAPFTGPSDEVIDIITEQIQPVPPYDVVKAQQVMDECEKCVGFVRLEEDPDVEDWEDAISRTGWTSSQSTLFNKVVKILHADRLSRLANSGDKNEPVLRRIFVDKTAQRFREAMASVMWDTRLTQWLHSVLIDNLGTSYLAAYLDILQTLKSRIPTLVEKMMASNSQLAKTTPIGAEGLNLLLKRPWDPAASSINQHKLRKLPGNPIIIVVPSGMKRQQVMTPRAHLWSSHLANLGSVVNVASSLSHLGTKLTTHAYLEQLITVTKSKVAEARAEYPRRPIVLVGWRSGAALACQVAVTDLVTAVVCLGFSTNTVEGPRGEPDDSILDIQCPVLFVTGENAAAARPEDLEEMREKMRVQTGLLVVGSADDCLRMGKMKKRQEGVTQSMVDRCILEEIGDFLAACLTSPRPVLNPNDAKRGIFSRRRHNSTTSSVDSESSNARRSRPGTPQSQIAGNSSMTPKTQVLAQVNGTMKANVIRPATRGRRPGSGKKAQNLAMNPTFHSTGTSQQQQQLNNSNGGITVNIGSIGSLGSLGPIGPLRMNPNTGTASSSASFVSLTQPTVKTPATMIDAAPPADVMPLRDSSEGNQPDIVKPTTSPGNQLVSKGTTRLIVAPSTSTASNNVPQIIPTKITTTTGPRLSIPATPNVAAPKEEKKPQTPMRQVITANSRINTLSQPVRGTTQLIEKAQAKMTKSIATARQAANATILNPQVVTRPQVRTVQRNPTIIKTSPAPRASTSQSVRPQKFSLAQNAGKFVTTSGTNIILLENSTGQNRPVIVPFSGSSPKVSTPLRASPQKLAKSSPLTTTKSPAVTKLAMSKKIIPTSSLLQQRPLLLRNRTPVTTTKHIRTETVVEPSQSDVVEIPVYYEDDGEEQHLLVQDQPVVIPIIDSSKSKSSKKSLPKDISYTEDGDSISFPLDCDIETVEDDSTVKVLIGTMNRVVKTPQIYVTKSTGPNVKKLQSFIPNKRRKEEVPGPSQERQETKYFINYTDDNEEGVLYEIVEEN